MPEASELTTFKLFTPGLGVREALFNHHDNPVLEYLAGFPRSWKILEKIVVMESHGKVLEYENYPKSHGKVMELLLLMAVAAF